MKVLVTAGATITPIDQVRCISNIFKGSTGFFLSRALTEAKHEVTLLTSGLHDNQAKKLLEFKTYGELRDQMAAEVGSGQYQAIFHSAAVSDYELEGVYDPDLKPIDRSSKISSEHKSLFLKLTPTEKLVDKIRTDWGFSGMLVKFKLQVGISDDELLEIAKRSREQSKADYIVANCLEWCHKRAYIVSAKNVVNVDRTQLSKKLAELLDI